MGTIYDLLLRTNAILSKYEKYDAPLKSRNGKQDDPFLEEFEEVEAEVEKLQEAAGDVALEQNRAVIAAKNAEIRRAKNVLLTEAVQALQKKLKKGKGVTKDLIAERQGLIKELIDRIYAVPDGMSMGTRRPGRYTAAGKKGPGVTLDSVGADKSTSNPLYYSHTEQTQAFDKEWEVAKAAQDKQLEMIEQGVNELGNMAKDIGEELDKQAPVIDDIEHQMDKVTGSLKSNNAKLKGILENMRSRRNFCVDVVLICVLLAIGAYIYATFAKK